MDNQTLILIVIVIIMMTTSRVYMGGISIDDHSSFIWVSSMVYKTLILMIFDHNDGGNDDNYKRSCIYGH